MTRALLYLRQSDTDGEGDRSLSLDSQASVLRSDAQRLGWSIVAELRDPDLRGADDQRPGLLSLYERCRAGDVDLVAFWNLERLARSVRITENVVHELQRLGVSLHSSQEPWITDFPFLRQVLAAAAEQQTRVIKAHVRRALRERARRGLHQGRVPFGYIRPDKDSALIPDPKRAPVVREIFDLRVSGVGPADIADVLTRRGVLTPEGHPWTVGRIMRILERVTYRGAVKSGDLILEDCHEALVPADIWQAVQSRRFAPRTPRRKGISSWLEGRIQHECGYAMYLIQENITGDPHFRCRNMGHGNVNFATPGCAISPKNINKDRAERLVWEAIQRDLGRLTPPQHVMATAQATYHALGTSITESHQTALRRKKSATQRRVRAEELFLSGARDRAWFDVEDQKLQLELEEIDRLLIELPTPPDPDAIEQTWQELHELQRGLSAYEDHEKRQLLHALGVAVLRSTGNRVKLRNGKDGGEIVIRYRREIAQFIQSCDHKEQ